MDTKKMVGLVDAGSIISKLGRRVNLKEAIEARLEEQAVARATRRAIFMSVLTSLLVSAVVVAVALRGGSLWRSICAIRGTSSEEAQPSSAASPRAPSGEEPYGGAVTQPTI